MKKPLLQRIPLRPEESFVARTFASPDFEVGWHQHTEIELILFTSGSGLSFIGNHVGNWKTGDIYLLGSGLPHSFQKSDPHATASALVVQFLPGFWGTELMGLPESRSIAALLNDAGEGLKLNGKTRAALGEMVRELEHTAGFMRILLLGHCLERIAAGDFQAVAASGRQFSAKEQSGPIDRVFNFTIEQFRRPVSLREVAELACMSIPSFCNWFKKSTKKTYIDFLNEVRVGYACKQLIDTQNPVPQIGYDAGYNTSANFHKQFLKVKGISPLKYRKQFSGPLSLPQNNIHIVSPL